MSDATTSDQEWDAAARLKSKVVMVVGATSGIGRAVSLRVAAEGATVVAAGRRADLGEDLAAEIVASGGQASPAANAASEPVVPRSTALGS